MEISFNGFNENVLTFKCDAGVAEGDPVNVTASGTVSKTPDDGKFDGICVRKEDDGYAAVQLKGYAELPTSGSVAVNFGYTRLVHSSGGVKMGSSGRELLVVYRDENTVGFML